MSQAASEVTWIVRLLEELGVNSLKPVELHCDNQSAIHIAKNPIFHERTKHIEVDCHFTRDKVLDGLITLSYLPTQHQLADILTKILPGVQHRNLSSKLGMVNVFPIPSLRGGVGLHSTAGAATKRMHAHAVSNNMDYSRRLHTQQLPLHFRKFVRDSVT